MSNTDKEYILKNYFEYLNKLRDSGVTNMWGSAKYLVEEFGIGLTEAKAIFQKWVDSFKP